MNPATRPSWGNPVHPDYLADPFVWRVDREYYAIGTGRDEAAGVVGSSHEPSVFPLLQSTDLKTWSVAGHALVRPDPALGNAFWAPEIASAEGRWYLYYSVGHDDRNHQLRVASSAAPLGPYVDAGPLTDTQTVPFAIDPHPFRDADGRWYLFHARDFLDSWDEQGRAVRAGTALVVSPLETMTALGSDVRTVARARCDWQRFAAERPMYGAVYDWHTLEGPFVVRNDGKYYCLYSGGCWQTDTYGVDYVIADSVLGPWRDDGADDGPRVLRSEPGRVVGPGHCSVVIAHDGSGSFIAYHAWDPEMTARRLCIDPLRFTPDGPRLTGPDRPGSPGERPGPTQGA
jgi:beta-xylosidase